MYTIYGYDVQNLANGYTVANRAVRLRGGGTGKMVQLCMISHDDCLQVFLNIPVFREYA